MKKKIKVLCSGRFYDEIPGGMQRHVEQLFHALKDDVDYVHLVPSRDWSEAHSSLHGFPVIRKKSINLDGSLAISPGLPIEAFRLNSKIHFDLVHLHFPDPMSHLASLVLPRSIPRVITWHADIVRHKKLLQLYWPLLRRSIDTASAVIAPTPNHIDSSPELTRLAGSPSLHVVPFGFDLDRFTSESKDTSSIRARHGAKRIIFALGRHVYYKGFDVLIRAMVHVDPSAELIIGGVGPLTETWKSLAKELGVDKRIHFAGMIDEEQLPAYYQASDIFCLPAINNAEAFGIVQVEAMACGLPIVSTKLSSGVSYVNQHEESGLLVEVENIAELASALNRLVHDDALREKLGNQARARAINMFSAKIMGQRTLEIYRSCLNR